MKSHIHPSWLKVTGIHNSRLGEEWLKNVTIFFTETYFIIKEFVKVGHTSNLRLQTILKSEKIDVITDSPLLKPKIYPNSETPSVFNIY